jgi:hypothetical protein
MKAAGAKVVGMDTGVPEWIGQIDTHAEDPSLVKDMCRQMDEMVSKVRPLACACLASLAWFTFVMGYRWLASAVCADFCCCGPFRSLSLVPRFLPIDPFMAISGYFAGKRMHTRPG